MMNLISKEDEDHQDDQGNDDIDLDQLPRIQTWVKWSPFLSLYKGFWIPSNIVRNVKAFQTHFKPRSQDIILASLPKSGTTWLKALLFSIVNRSRYTRSNTPLLTANPHQLIPFFELTIYANAKAKSPDLTNIGSIVSPRLFSTHLAYQLLPESVTKDRSDYCRIVYICRNPLDTIVSFWHFVNPNGLQSGHQSIEDYVEGWCRGEHMFGPFWDQVLGYWKESLEKPEKVLFLRYEDMKEETELHVKKIAEFVGFQFSKEEESQGVIAEILELCSLRTLSDLEVNKSGEFIPNLDKKCFFRKGEIGDWVNYLTPSMVERIMKITKQKLSGSGLSFKYQK